MGMMLPGDAVQLAWPTGGPCARCGRDGIAGQPVDLFGSRARAAVTLAASGRVQRSGRVAVLMDKSAGDVDAFHPWNVGKVGRLRFVLGRRLR